MSDSAYFTITLLDENHQELVDIIKKNPRIFSGAVCENGEADGPAYWEIEEQMMQMRELSLTHPNLVFVLTREEINHETVRYYYSNGKVQEANATITFDDFDKSRLV